MTDYGEHNLESLINMTPDQRFERNQQSSQPIVSALIKSSVQHQVQPESSVQPNLLRPLLVNHKEGGESKFDNQISKVSKDSLTYSAGDDERQTAHQKSTLSGTSDDQLSSHLVSDQQTFLRNPIGELGSGGSQNIQIHDFSKHQDLGKLIINESVPRGEVLTNSFNQAGSFKKSSKRVTQAEVTQAISTTDTRSGAEASHEVMRSSPVQTTQIREVVTQNREQTILRHEVLSQQTGSTQYLHPNQEIPTVRVQESVSTFRSQPQTQPIPTPERQVPTLPLTATHQPQLPPANANQTAGMVSSTGHSTPGEHSQRTDRVTTQYQTSVQTYATGPVKPTASSLLAGKVTNQAQHPPRPTTERVSSSTGTQRAQATGPTPPLAAQQAPPQPGTTQRPNPGQSVLALRSSQSQSQSSAGQTQVITRTLAATPEVLEYVRTHQGQLPQDTVINHPPKVVAEYTLDADGNRVAYGAQELQFTERHAEPQSPVVQQHQAENKPRVSERKVAEPPRVPVQPQPIVQRAPAARTFGEERVHQIEEEVIIENKPYIIDPKTRQKIYVDPNNLKAYASMFKPNQEGAHATVAQTQVAAVATATATTHDGKPRSVLRPSSHAPKPGPTQADGTLLKLGPHTQVVQVPRSSQAPAHHLTTTVSARSTPQGVHAPATRAPPQDTGRHLVTQKTILLTKTSGLDRNGPSHEKSPPEVECDLIR